MLCLAELSITGMIYFLIAAYRRFPYRPHCDSAHGIHAWTCRLAGMSGTRCPCKDA